MVGLARKWMVGAITPKVDLYRPRKLCWSRYGCTEIETNFPRLLAMFRFISSNILMLIGLVFFAACATIPAREDPPLQVVSQVDINRYLGRWYEIARYPNWFQENCYAVQPIMS